MGQTGRSDRAHSPPRKAGRQIMSRRKRMLEELDQDIRDHIEKETQDNIERGMPPEEARYAAVRKFGNVTRVKEETREVWSFVCVEQLLQDIQFGLRMLRKSPGFAAVAILTLGLGISANTAIFSLIDAVMLRALPVDNPSELVLLRWSARNAPNIHGYHTSGDCPMNVMPGAANPYGCSFSEPMFREIVQANVFSGTAAFANSGRLNLTGNGPATVINGQLVSGDFFRTMGLKPAAGRLFEAGDDAPSAAPVAVLNYGYWQSAFGGSRDVIGRTLELNNVPFTIIGVVEQRFTGITPGSDYDVWLPLSDGQRITDPMFWRNRPSDVGDWWLTIIGRLKPETPVAQAQAAVSGLFRNEMLHGAVPLFHGGESAMRTGASAGRGVVGNRTFQGAMPPAGGNGPASARALVQQAPGSPVQARREAGSAPMPQSAGNAPVMRHAPSRTGPEERDAQTLLRVADNPEVTLLPAQTRSASSGTGGQKVVQRWQCAGGSASGACNRRSGRRRPISAYPAEPAEHRRWIRFAQYLGFRNRSYIDRVQRPTVGRLLSRPAGASSRNARREVRELLGSAIVE